MKRAFIALLLLAACHPASVRVSLLLPAHPPRAKEYVDQLKRWTRYGHVREDFDDTLSVHATLQSPEFRAAFAAKWIVVYKIPEPEATRVRAELVAEVADVWEFHIESAAHSFDVDNFIPLKKVWRVALVDDKGREVVPSEVRGEKTRREIVNEFYPERGVYPGIFTRAWRIRFPRLLADGTQLVQPDTKTLTLQIAGPKGVTEMVWHLKPGGSPAPATSSSGS